MKKCEWGHDDYSLEIENLPQSPPAPEEAADDAAVESRRTFGKGASAHSGVAVRPGGRGGRR